MSMDEKNSKSYAINKFIVLKLLKSEYFQRPHFSVKRKNTINLANI